MSSEMTDSTGRMTGGEGPHEGLQRAYRQQHDARTMAARSVAVGLYVAGWQSADEVEVDLEWDLLEVTATKLRHLHSEYREWIEAYVDARRNGIQDPQFPPPPARPIVETINIGGRMRVRQRLSWTPTAWQVHSTETLTLGGDEHTALVDIFDVDAVVVRVMTEDDLVPVSADGVHFSWE